MVKQAPKIAANMTGRRKLAVLASLNIFTQAIADAADGAHQLRAEALVDLGAQAADMRFDYAGLRVEMEIPDILEQHGAGDDAALAAHQIFEQAELLRLEVDRLAGAADRPLQQVHLEIGGPQHGLRLADRRAPQQSRNPRQELRKGERLDQVVIGAGIETLDAVVYARHGGEKDRRHLVSRRPQHLDDAQSIEPGKHAVDDHRIIF